MAARHPPCRALKPKEKDYKVTDRDGMYVHVTAKGAMSFRMDYRLNGRRETIYLGKYGPEGLSLARAREKCIDARRNIAARYWVLGSNGTETSLSGVPLRQQLDVNRVLPLISGLFIVSAADVIGKKERMSYSPPRSVVRAQQHSSTICRAKAAISRVSRSDGSRGNRPCSRKNVNHVANASRFARLFAITVG